MSSNSASIQEKERVALMEPLQPEDPQGKECDLSELENSESDNSQISEDSLAEKGYQSPQSSPGDSLYTNGHGHPRTRARASVRGFTTSSQSSGKPGLMTSSDECCFLKNPCHSNISIAAKEDCWPQGSAPLRKNSSGQVGQLSHNSQHPLKEEKAQYQESSKEAIGGHTSLSFAFPSGPEPCLHSTPWSPFQSSLQPPPLEAFYVTKSRDALTETALEIPACREARVPSPSPREAWGFGHDFQVLQNVCLENNLPVLLQKQNPKVASSQQVTAERTVDPNTKEVSGEIGKCPGNVKEESHHSVYFFVAQNRHFLTSTRTKVCGFENQVGNLNKHSLPGLKEGNRATVQSYCNVSSDSSGSSKSFLVCESEAVGEEEQGQNSVLRQTQAFDINRQFPSKDGSDFIYKTINLGLEKDMLGKAAFPLKSRSVHPRVSSPEIMAQDESPTHRGEGKNETGLPWTETTHEKFQSVTCSQERNLSECKGPGKSQETLNPKEPLSGKRPNKRFDNANEMARLIKSVMQLENGILEFESKQNKQLCASNTLGVGNEFVFRDQKDQEMADHVLRTGSSGHLLPFKDQPSSPEQTDDAIFSDGKAGEMEANSSFGRDPQVQKITLNPFKSRECVQDIKFVRELTHPAVLDRPARDACDYLGTCAAHRESTNISVTPRRMKALARTAPLQARCERSSEEEDRLVHASASSRGQPCGLGSLEDWETMKGFQESHVAKPIGSSKQEEPKVQGGVKEMTMQRGENLQEEYRMVSLTQKLPSPNQRCMGTFFSQETNPLLSQPDCSAAPHQDLSNTLPLDSSRLPRRYLHTPDVIGISSVDYVMDPTVLKMPNGFWVTGAGYQDQSGEPRRHSPQGDVRGGSSMAQTAWCGPVMSMAVGSRGQSSVPENIPLGIEGRRSASTRPQDQGGGLRSTSMGLSTRTGSASEAEAAVQRGTKRASSLNRASSQLDKRASCPLEDNDQGRGLQQKAQEEAEDLSPTSAAFSAPVSLPVVPHLEPSAHTSTGLAELEEIRQAKAQGRQLHDLVAAGTVLPYCETLLEPECFSRAPGRPQCQQMDQPVSGNTKYEGEAQGFHVASFSAAPGHLWTDKRKVLQATALSLDSFQPLPNTEINRGLWQPSQTSSHVDPALDKSLCSRELRHFLGACERFICHSSPFEIIEEKKEATRIPYSADLLDSDSLPSSTAMVEDRRVTPEKVVATSSSQDPSDDPGLSQHGQSQLACCGTAEGVPPSSQESRPAYQEHRTLDTTYGGGLGNFLVTAPGGKTNYFESQLMICNQNSASLSVSNQDHVQGHKASNSLEEGRASPKQGTILPGALRRAELEAPSQQCMNRKGSVDSGLTEACTTVSKHPRPAPFSDQKPSPHPGGVRKEAPCRCSQETSDCVVFSGSIEDRRTLSPSRGQEDSRTLPCLPLCSCQPIASHACSSPSPTLLCYKEGDLRKGTSKAASQTPSLPCILSSWAYGMDEREESYSGEPDMFLAHGLEPQGIHVKFGPTDCSTLEPSAAPAVLSLAQGCSSPSAPDVRTGSLSHSVADGSSRSIGDPKKKVAEKKASTELEAAPFPTDVYSEPLRKCQDGSLGSQNAQESQTKLQLPITIERPHTLNVNEASVENELPVEPQHACFENDIRCLPEKPQLSTKSRSHSGLDRQAKFITKLKRISSSQADNPWEEEKEQREQASGGGEDLAQDSCSLHSNKGGLDGYQIRDAGREDGPVAKAHVSKTFSSGFEDFATAPLGPVTQNPGQPSSGREQLALHHRRSLPVIAIFSGPSNFRSSPRPQFSVISSSRSLQELNLTVEPPSPTDEETWEPNKLWNPHPRGHSLGKSSVGTSLKAEDCNQKASSNLDNSTADHRPLKPASPPYPTSSAPSCMPTPNMTSWTSGTLEQAQRGKPEGPGGQARPEKWPSKADKGVLRFGSSDTSPCFPPWHAEGPGRVGWKQYVFGSAVNVSSGQTSQGRVPSNMARCSSMDSGLEDQNSPFYPHLSTYASAQALSGPCSSIENAQGSQEPWKVWDSSLALGNSHVLTGPEGAAPTTGPDKRAQFLGTSDEAGCLRSEPPWAEGSAAGPVDEIMLPYPSEAGGPVGQPRVNTLEQGTQTLGCRPLWNHTDISSAQSEVSTMPVSDLVSWTSMHNLSLHLSQLLHSTSELLGSLSQPSVAEKERNTKRETPDEAAQTLMLDGCTQTTIDEGIQTDLASPPVCLRAPAASPQEVNVVLEVLGSDISTMSQENGHVPGTPLKRETEETAWKTAGPPDLQEESTYCRPQSPPIPSSHLRFQKAPFGQNLPSVSPQASPGASLPPSSQLEEPCLAVSTPSLSISHSSGPSPNATESVGEPRVQQELSPMSAVLVDRASSPILILSASTQRSGLPLGSLFLSAPAAQFLEGPQKLISSPDLPLDAPRPPMNNSSETTDDESGGSQRVEAPGGEGRGPLEKSDSRSFLEVTSPGSPQQSPQLQVHFLEPSYQQLKSQTTTTWVQSRVPPLPPRSRSQKPAVDFVPEDMASLECGPLSSRGPSCWQSKTGNRGEKSASPVEPQSTLDSSSLGGLQHSPCPVPELTDNTGLQESTLGPTEACQSQGMLCPSSQTCMAPEPQHHSLRDLPVHNKFSNWCGVQHGSSGGLGMMELQGSRCDLSSREKEQRPPQPPDNQSQDPERSQREQVPLQVGAQNLSLSMELTEAKLHHGFGESDALLQVLQSGTGEALTADEPVLSTWEELYARQKRTIETLRRQRAERLHNFRRTRSLSPQKQLSFLPNRDLPTHNPDLPSRRREYLQQLRKDVVETTRRPGSASRSAHPPSDIELMLREYQRAREEAKVEIARARDRLRERTEQEKLRIRQQIISQLLREEEKLHTLGTSSSLCTSSNGSLSSGVTSGYNSSPALSGQLQSPDSVGDTNLPDSGDSWIGDVRGRSTVRNSHLNLAGSPWKSLAYSRRASLGSCCCSPSSLCNLGTCFSSSYQDLAKHIVDISMADVMAACSGDLYNLFSRQAAAGWNYQGEEQEVQLYYKVFSSTRHGFLGAGVVSQPLSHVWAAVSDPTLWPLYHKPIQTVRLHQRVTNSINLVYLVCNPALCALKQPRDFCCVCVEAKEGHLSVMAAQSVYDASMPRPSRDMVRGEILPSAWILQPLIMEGKEITRVIYLAQVELGAPGFSPQQLSSFIKQQPLVIARLASFLGS
uniref:StAR related lipid transfer domain containing 9 n=1 Tax=Rousettus aegyptiacus TaxID=9407 RepID=A0A7J8ISX3_ROUAE|nr:StAR related lipid transfer domain containing 9 [Rousettus aegyptiacus]